MMLPRDQEEGQPHLVLFCSGPVCFFFFVLLGSSFSALISDFLFWPAAYSTSLHICWTLRDEARAFLFFFFLPCAYIK